MASRAAYMREYRARQKVDAMNADPHQWTRDDLRTATSRITELEAEVKHLKAELAKRPLRFGRPEPDVVSAMNAYNTRPFTPVPKSRSK